MDNGNGKFVQLPDDQPNLLEQNKKILRDNLEELYPKHGGWFREGEILKLRGITFKVKLIQPTELWLKLLAKTDQNVVFNVGEVLSIRDSIFRVKSIKPTILRLKLMARAEPKEVHEKIVVPYSDRF